MRAAVSCFTSSEEEKEEELCGEKAETPERREKRRTDREFKTEDEQDPLRRREDQRPICVSQP